MKVSELLQAWPRDFATESQQDLSHLAAQSANGRLALEPHNIRAQILNRDVSELFFDSRKVQTHSIYIAIRGDKSDGHDFLENVVRLGADVLVLEDIARVPSSFGGLIYQVQNTREALARLAAKLYAEPSQKLFVVGVTGTNGKTTTTYLIEALLNSVDVPTGVIGTINHHLKDRSWPSEMTTPDPVSFQSRLREFKDLGARAVALEVSSHALAQHRVDSVDFDVAIFTNLTRDHLDYHGSMENYFQAKVRLFRELLVHSRKNKKVSIINGDDPSARELIHGTPASTTSEPGTSEVRAALSETSMVWRYGMASGFELKFTPLEMGFGGTRFLLETPHGSREFKVSMPGLHNVYNAVAAIGCALVAGATLDAIAEALAQFSGVPGRLQSVPNARGIFAFVDYAHTDDAIRTVLKNLNAIRASAKLKNRIITVFGCGGDRDRGKRPLMMKAALDGSDHVILTSDNPRTEDPIQILRDVAVDLDSSLSGVKVFEIVDRRSAMMKAVSLAQPHDVILIAGKGHENYQIIGTTKQPFSDFDIMKELLA